MNSIIANVCSCAEAEYEHLSISAEAQTALPAAAGDLVVEISERELRQQLFQQLQRRAETAAEFAAVASLQDDCATGNVRGSGGVDREVKRQMRRQAREVLGQLLEI